MAKKKSVTKSSRAGTTFPVGRIQRKLRKGNYANRISPGAAVYMAGVLEYLASEVLELSGEAAIQNKKKRINPRHIMMAVRKDDELDKLLRNVIISESGVIPRIHAELLPENSKNKKSKKKSSQKSRVVSEVAAPETETSEDDASEAEASDAGASEGESSGGESSGGESSKVASEEDEESEEE